MDGAVLDEVHRYWFGPLNSPTDYPADKAPVWFGGGPEVDAEIEARFGAHLKPAAAFQGDYGKLSREQRVGLVVLLDQFPRNIFRTSAEAFAYDSDARRHTRAVMSLGPYFLIERSFLALPFEHSEGADDQALSVRLFAQMHEEAPAEQKATYANFLDYAVKHRDLIARFGRFPHRNTVLGRVSTAEEAAFMEKNGRGY